MLKTLKPQSPLYSHREALANPEYNVFYSAGTLIIVCAKPEGVHAEDDCSFAAQNLMLATHATGLGTCPVGFAQPWLRCISYAVCSVATASFAQRLGKRLNITSAICKDTTVAFFGRTLRRPGMFIRSIRMGEPKVGRYSARYGLNREAHRITVQHGIAVASSR